MFRYSQLSRVLRTSSAALLAAVSTTLVGNGLVANAAIIGKDDRITPTYSWLVNTGRQPIGRLEIQAANGLYYTCSFTVVGRNIGLTNTHCLRDSSGRGPRQVKAFALQYGSRQYAAANVDYYWTGLPKSPVTMGDQTKDWAIVRFTTNLGNITGWFGNEGYSFNVADSGRTVANAYTNLVGYSGGGTTPTAHIGCYFGQVVSGILMHRCDSLGGSSGSGLHNNSRVQGLHWGSFTYQNATINGSVPLERFMPAVQKLRDNGALSSTTVPVP